MIKKLFTVALFCALLCAFNFQASAENRYPYLFNERFAVRTMLEIFGAEITYQATDGSGDFGSLNVLLQLQLIDSTTASGKRYGYDFVVQTTVHTGNTPASFTITATPQRYRKTGRTSFYIGTSGILRGADKNGAPADGNDPIIESCSVNENCTISTLRTLHSAEITYQSTQGNGNYGTLNQLFAADLVSELLARGYANGYNFTIAFTVRTNNDPPTFSISAVPITYGVTGFRSFYIAADGVIHAADRHGAPATADDPPIE